MRALPDVTSDLNADTPSPLQWVGMEDIAIPINVSLPNGSLQTTTAKVKVYVSLDKPDAKGIHMSRLHHIINQLADRECNQQTIEQLLDEMVSSQMDIGQEAKIELSFDILLKKSALLSDNNGFQSYPVTISAEKKVIDTADRAFGEKNTLVSPDKRNTDFFYTFGFTIPYSSTCPCSASLARQLYSDAIDNKFLGATINKADLVDWIKSPAGSVATPHSQRSYAYINLSIANTNWPDISELIFQFEKIIGTPVQTAVKRIDEQAFAKLNAENLMFCEDAARRIKLSLEAMSFVNAYYFKVEHQESLHAHNAVVIDQKTKS